MRKLKNIGDTKVAHAKAHMIRAEELLQNSPSFGVNQPVRYPVSFPTEIQERVMSELPYEHIFSLFHSAQENISRETIKGHIRERAKDVSLFIKTFEHDDLPKLKLLIIHCDFVQIVKELLDSFLSFFGDANVEVDTHISLHLYTIKLFNSNYANQEEVKLKTDAELIAFIWACMKIQEKNKEDYDSFVIKILRSEPLRNYLNNPWLTHRRNVKLSFGCLLFIFQEKSRYVSSLSGRSDFETLLQTLQDEHQSIDRHFAFMVCFKKYVAVRINTKRVLSEDEIELIEKDFKDCIKSKEYPVILKELPEVLQVELSS